MPFPFQTFMKKVHKPPIPTDGLVVYYPFNGNTDDESGNGNTMVNFGATLTTDRFGNPNRAYHFNASSFYMRSQLAIPARGSTGLTVSVWVDPVTWNSKMPVSQRDFAVGLWQFFTTTANSQAYVWTGGSSQIATTAHTYTGWTNLFMTSTGLNGAPLDFYINNSLVDSITLTADIDDASQFMTIGRAGQAAALYWDGDIGTIIMYNRRVSDAERTIIIND